MLIANKDAQTKIPWIRKFWYSIVPSKFLYFHGDCYQSTITKERHWHSKSGTILCFLQCFPWRSQSLVPYVSLLNSTLVCSLFLFLVILTSCIRNWVYVSEVGRFANLKASFGMRLVGAYGWWGKGLSLGKNLLR